MFLRYLTKGQDMAPFLYW